jgi:hypothetical protein
MKEEIINTYSQAVNNLSAMIDQGFRNELLKNLSIETLDPKWKPARKNIEGYINHISQQNDQIKQWLSYEGYFLFEDIAALLLELLWQNLHSNLETEETIRFYKNYKIQISDKNLLTAPSNN